MLLFILCRLLICRSSAFINAKNWKHKRTYPAAGRTVRLDWTTLWSQMLTPVSLWSLLFSTSIIELLTLDTVYTSERRSHTKQTTCKISWISQLLKTHRRNVFDKSSKRLKAYLMCKWYEGFLPKFKTYMSQESGLHTRSLWRTL